MKGRKKMVFWVINIQLVLFFVLIIFFAREYSGSLGAIIIGAIISNGAVYVGGNVLHAWQKSKYFQPALAENNNSIKIIQEDEESL